MQADGDGEDIGREDDVVEGDVVVGGDVDAELPPPLKRCRIISTCLCVFVTLWNRKCGLRDNVVK